MLPSGWQRVVTLGALRGRIFRTLTAELKPGLDTVTVILVPTLERLLDQGGEGELAADTRVFLKDFFAQPLGQLTVTVAPLGGS